ncbi:MAG TPA: flippase [Methanomassiliicoccales archaeon]|nr:flippase [Methanomassiliicoccales archaeon]
MIGRRSFILFLSRLLSSALAFVGLYFMTRYLGKDIYGSVTWTLAFVATFNAVSDLGFGSAHIKRISEGQDLDDCVSTFAIIKLTLTGIMVAFILVSVFVWTSVLGGTLEETSTDLILLFVLFQVLFDISSIATATFQAKMEMAKLPLVTLIDPIVRVPLIIFVCVNFMGVIELAFTYVIGALAVAIMALYLLFRDHIKWRRPTLFRSYYKFALPLALIAIISVLSSTMDKLLLGFFWTSGEVGLYSAPQVFLGVFAAISTAVAALTFPSFSKLHSEGNLKQIRTLTRQAERYIMMIGLPVSIVIIMFPFEVCLVLLGPLFEESGKAIGIMAVTNLIMMLNAVHASQIIAVDRPDLSARITLMTFVVSLGMFLLFIPDSFLGFGLGLSFTGAAIALLIGTTFNFLVIRYVVWHLTGTTTDPRLALQLLAGVAAAVALALCGMFIEVSSWFMLVVFGLMSIGTFILTLYALKEFTREDYRFFMELANVKKMISYFKDELKKK